jgi:hypothetical protein
MASAQVVEPTPDQTYCDLDMHQQCSGYTEDESDPETCMCSCHDAQLRLEHEQEAERAGKPEFEIGKYHSGVGGVPVKIIGDALVLVTPMIVNDRVVLASVSGWHGGFIAGWCYDKGVAAYLAALAWDPVSEPRPAGFKKEAYDAR